MGCFTGDKMNAEVVMSPEQKQMYQALASMINTQMGQGYQTPPMYSAGPNPGQLSGMDYVMKQLGYGGYQHPGLFTTQSQNIPMQGMPQLAPNTMQISGTGLASRFPTYNDPRQQRGRGGMGR